MSASLLALELIAGSLAPCWLPGSLPELMGCLAHCWLSDSLLLPWHLADSLLIAGSLGSLLAPLLLVGSPAHGMPASLLVLWFIAGLPGSLLAPWLLAGSQGAWLITASLTHYCLLASFW